MSGRDSDVLTASAAIFDELERLRKRFDARTVQTAVCLCIMSIAQAALRSSPIAVGALRADKEHAERLWNEHA